MSSATIETKKCVRFADGDVLDLSGRDTITYRLGPDGRTLVLPTEAAVSPEGRHGDVVHLTRALGRLAPPLPPEVAARIRAHLEEGYRLLGTHLVLA